MKKQIVTFFVASFLAGSFVACGSQNDAAPPVGNLLGGSVEGMAGLHSIETAVPQKEETAGPQSKVTTVLESGTAEKERYVYGEDELPDIPCGDASLEGKADMRRDQEKLRRCLNSMVFETHRFGDYTVSLVGDSVRADETNFPGSIYAQKLRVEVEKDGVKLEGDGSYSDTVLYAQEHWKEYRLLADKIGSYLDVYDMQYPVIAMRYYFEDDQERLVKNTVEFAIIQEGRLWSGFVGNFGKGAGVICNPDADTSGTETLLGVNSENGGKCRAGIYDGGEFDVLGETISADEKTILADDETGIWYFFQFSNPPQTELYTARVVHSKYLYKIQDGKRVKVDESRLTSSEWEQLKPIYDLVHYDKVQKRAVCDADPGQIARAMSSVFGDLEKGKYECVVCDVDQLSSLEFAIE